MIASKSPSMKFILAVSSLLALPPSCTHPGLASLDAHFATFKVPPPEGNTVVVCHAYGCQRQTKFRFTDADISQLRSIMATWQGTEHSAEDERRGVAYAIGWMETRVGDVIGTSADRAGMDFAGNGDPTQQDCVDESTNTTSYLSVLAHAGLLHHHAVGIPFAKDNYLRGVAGWTHWTAILTEKSQGQRWAVDSWIYANGENPAIVKAEDWYLTGLDSMPIASH